MTKCASSLFHNLHPMLLNNTHHFTTTINSTKIKVHYTKNNFDDRCLVKIDHSPTEIALVVKKILLKKKYNTIYIFIDVNVIDEMDFELFLANMRCPGYRFCLNYNGEEDNGYCLLYEIVRIEKGKFDGVC